MVLKKTIDRILPETAERLPDKTALIFADRTFTYRQLEYLTNRTANGLKALGVKKGDRVSLFAQNSAEWVQSYIGIAKAGAVINPVNAMLTADELAYVVKDCGAKVLITTSERAKAVSDLRKDGSLDHVIVLSGVPPEGAISFTDLLAEQADSVEAPGNAPEELSTICYTSGTTGFPKGAMLSHESVVLSAAMTAAMNVRTEHDIQFTALPLAHVYGTVVMNLSFMLGLTFVMLERFDTRQALESIPRHKVTIMDGVPTMYLYMLSHPDFGDYDLSSLRTAVVGGQAMPPAKVVEWLERVGTPILERARRSRHHAAFLRGQQAGLGRHFDAVHARANRRSGGPCKDAARGRGGRADGQGPVHHARLLRKREGHQGGNRARRVAALRRSLQDGREAPTSLRIAFSLTPSRCAIARLLIP
jgi:long-chain acyl-CoA synthetase